MYYSRDFIINVIKNYDRIESVKEKTTKPLIPNSFVTDSDYDTLSEGNTLRNNGFGGSRVPKNTNNIIEVLCCITADIESALDILEPDERMSIFLVYGPYKNFITTKMSELSEQGLQKMVNFLNGYKYLYN